MGMKTDIDQICNYIIMNPTGNVTALVTSRAEISRQPFIAGKIMERHPEVEQVGFVDLSGSFDDPVQASLRMAGGEFCGNASMCTAVLYAEKNQTKPHRNPEIKLQVSGTKEVVSVKILGSENGITEASVVMPHAINIEIKELSYQAITAPLPLIQMQGITHLIIEEQSSFYYLQEDRAAAQKAVKKWCEELSAEGLGLMFLSGTAPALKLTPLVYIPESKTVFWENSCGSGSSACGIYMAEKTKKDVKLSLQQPGGVLSVESSFHGNTIMTGSVRQLDSYIL